jgi:TonB family protein
MRRLWLITSFVLFTGALNGQQTGSTAPSRLMDALPGPVRVYASGQDVIAPSLLPSNLPFTGTEKCKKKFNGKVILSVIVDSSGRPRNLMFLRPLGTELDAFALQFAAADRFNPGTHDNAPVAVGQSLEVNMQTCLDETKDSAGKKSYSLRMRSLPEQQLGPLPQTPEMAVLTPETSSNIPKSNTPRPDHVGGSVSEPVPLITSEAEYTPEARKAKINGKCLVSLIVDRHGMPQNLRITKTLEPGLDQNALDAVAKYRFKPSMKNGEPVPVIATVEVDFKIW